MRRSLSALAFAVAAPFCAAQVQTLEPMTVSVTRSPEAISDIPFTVEEVPAEAFNDSFSMTVDDALRGSPDFSLFRRNDSLTANPTTQGVSLRGLGPSGASRSLVLLDGIPINDPFGGWVPWSMMPVGSIARAEIVPGGGASAWGNEALAGVIQLFSVLPAPGAGEARVSAGDFGTRTATVAQTVSAGPGTLDLRVTDFTSDGTVLISPAGRGPVDIDAATRHNVETADWHGPIGGGVSAVVTLRRFSEWRDNGTAYQQNAIQQVFGSVALSGTAVLGGTWNTTAYMQGQRSSQTFSSVNAARTSETPASDQFNVPADAVGFAGSATWTDGTSASTTVGADVRDVRGETREDFLYSGGTFTEQRFAGGRQTFAGAFAERTQPLGPGLHGNVGVRLDRWEDSDGHLRNILRSTGGLLLQSIYPTKTGNEFSPSAGLTWQATDELTLHVSGQHAFRQPTLNELYRPFKQGSSSTLANANLSTEHADTGEIGAEWRKGKLDLTLLAFGARLEDPVSNVTLAQGPGTFPLFGTLAAGATGLERLNLGRIDTQGGQFSASWKQSDEWEITLAVINEQATVEEASVAPKLVGKAVPEVPRWNASLGVTWHPVKSLHVDLRIARVSSQFDDDQNLLPLAAATVVDASARLKVARNAEIFLSVDNATDTEVETAHSATGVFNVAPPRMVDGGARFNW
ncbi:MAG TPA: TonB-dependent receptor [Opitutaceae bacterium]|nr:TonB-dependent receptor [Opitutaceae bacterium]